MTRRGGPNPPARRRLLRERELELEPGTRVQLAGNGDLTLM